MQNHVRFCTSKLKGTMNFTNILKAPAICHILCMLDTEETKMKTKKSLIVGIGNSR